MSEHNDQSVSDKLPVGDGQGKSLPEGARQKKVFVEPAVSLPVSVLEATTMFLQGGASSAGSPIP